MTVVEVRPLRRVNVNFSDQAHRTLEELAARSGKSMSDVLREAIALKVWFEHERAEGNRILVEQPNGRVREVISVSTGQCGVDVFDLDAEQRTGVTRGCRG